MKRNMLVIITIGILSTLAFVFIISKAVLAFRFNNEVGELFAHASDSSSNTYHSQDIDTLPEPVQRYFKLVLKEGQPYISYVRMTHDGQFKSGLDKEWVNITGVQYATTSTPGFIWKGTTSLFTARDMYIADKGRLVVSILSLIKVVDAKGAAYNQGELLRWLGESVLYPTNLLPSEWLQWSAIDSHSARLDFNYKDLSLFYIVTFNDLGEITQLETERYMDEKQLATWIIRLEKYVELNDVTVPTVFEVMWRLEKGDFSYAKFRMTDVQYRTSAWPLSIKEVLWSIAKEIF
jgi:hypothetical protein